MVMIMTRWRLLDEDIPSDGPLAFTSVPMGIYSHREAGKGEKGVRERKVERKRDQRIKTVSKGYGKS